MAENIRMCCCAYIRAMFIRCSFVCLLVTFLCYNNVYSQQSDFCDAVNTIIRDAPNKFRNLKGKVIESNVNAIISECGVRVPGTIGSRFILSMGCFYEGAFFQTKNKDAVKAYYDRYKGELLACLAPQGYVLTLADNFAPGMAEYKKVVLMQEVNENTKATSPPPHVTMEAEYSKETKTYTVVMYVFEH